MGFVHERTDSGLLVARESSDGEAVARALKDHDPDLRLIPQYSQELGQYWAVYRYKGSERDADLVCAWVDPQTREPLPLSHGLVERVKSRDRNLRGDHMEADEANQKRREELEKESARLQEDLIDDWVPREKRQAVLHRGQHLRMARSRSGYHDLKRGRHG